MSGVIPIKGSDATHCGALRHGGLGDELLTVNAAFRTIYLQTHTHTGQ